MKQTLNFSAKGLKEFRAAGAAERLNSKTLHVSDFESLWCATLEAQTILANYDNLYSEIRILANSGKCVKIVKR